jgi:hypothetical protein
MDDETFEHRRSYPQVALLERFCVTWMLSTTTIGTLKRFRPPSRASTVYDAGESPQTLGKKRVRAATAEGKSKSAGAALGATSF